MKEILKQNYQSYVKDTFLVHTKVQNKVKGVQLPEIHGAMKPLVPHKIPEKQPLKPVIIDDTSIVIDLDTKSDLDTELQDATVTHT